MKIIAEFGCNWDNRDQAYIMMGQAGVLGIKHIKFQLFKEEQVPKDLQHMCINEEFAQELVDTGKQYGQEVFFTPIYPKAVDICERIGVKYYKIRYFDRRNLILYRRLKKIRELTFVSTGHPDDTLYKNKAHYQKNVEFLYCVPEYPTDIKEYLFHTRKIVRPIYFDGISDHTANLELFEMALKFKDYIKWFEMHVCLDDNAYERKWSKTFEELKEVLNK